MKIHALSFPGCGVCTVWFLLAGVLGMPAHAQSWQPDKPIEIIAPSGPGGSTDKLARTVQRILQDEKIILVPASVLNKPGGNQTSTSRWFSRTAERKPSSSRTSPVRLRPSRGAWTHWAGPVGTAMCGTGTGGPNGTSSQVYRGLHAAGSAAAG